MLSNRFKNKLKDLVSEFGEPLGVDRFIYAIKFDELKLEAVQRNIITRDDADNWDVRNSNNLLNVLGIPHITVEAGEEQDDLEDKDSEYSWWVYWR